MKDFSRNIIESERQYEIIEKLCEEIRSDIDHRREEYLEESRDSTKTEEIFDPRIITDNENPRPIATSTPSGDEEEQQSIARLLSPDNVQNRSDLNNRDIDQINQNMEILINNYDGIIKDLNQLKEEVQNSNKEHAVELTDKLEKLKSDALENNKYLQDIEAWLGDHQSPLEEEKLVEWKGQAVEKYESILLLSESILESIQSLSQEVGTREDEHLQVTTQEDDDVNNSINGHELSDVLIDSNGNRLDKDTAETNIEVVNGEIKEIRNSLRGAHNELNSLNQDVEQSQDMKKYH